MRRPESPLMGAMLLGLLGLAVSPDAQAARVANRQGDVVITEIMVSPENGIADYRGQWFEIRNVSDELLFLEGLLIEDSDGGSISLPPSTGLQLAVGDHLVLGVNDQNTDSSASDFNGGIEIDILYSYFSDLSLQSDADSLTITHVGSGAVLDTVVWDNSWGIPSGASLQAGPQALYEWPNDLAHNWCASAKYIPPKGLKGTPGEDNEPCSGAGDDTDGDGYSESQGDCDDTDPDIHPGVIDGAGDQQVRGLDTPGDTSDDVYAYLSDPDDDADCDGIRDDGLTDDDGDGYAEVDGDCDDEYFYVNPGQSEGKNADGVDDDCNCWIDDVDQDGDGFTTLEASTYDITGLNEAMCQTAAETDCLDASDDIGVTGNPKLINPDAEEIPYDGIDQDCDGEDLCDVDGDTYDSEECGGLDCNDDNDNVHPGVPDASADPDGVDNDCDGIIDSPDRDGDGFGVNEGDCDDEDMDINPGVEERCDDMVDNNCDGWINEGCDYPALTASMSGGSLIPWGCSVSPGSAGGGAFVMALALAAALRRRKEG
ncbi:MAG: MopE-related protein [Myxococcota bacterium]|nr:MopE-related protein [Myxococcota bacterium]